MSCWGRLERQNGPLFTLEFESWSRAQFTAAELADPLISGPGADIDADGLNTLLEFALGLNPKSADGTGAFSASIADDGGTDYLALSFRKLKKSTGLSYRVEASGDLVDWTELAAEVGLPADNGDGTETVVVRDTLAFDSGARRFIRLVVGQD